MRAGLYVRVSSAKQVREGFSLDEQERACRAFIEARGWTLDEAHVFREAGISGAVRERPELTALLASLDALDAVVTPTITRLGRSAIHSLEIFDRFDTAGVELYGTDGRSYTKADKTLRGIEAILAERERDTIAERASISAADKRTRGRWNGGPRPMGYAITADGLVPDEAEAAIIRRIFREFLDGSSLKAIAARLNAEGIRGPKGGKWSNARVSDRLDSPLYAGRLSDGSPGTHEAIVAPEDWDKAHAIRTAPSARRGRRPSRHLLGRGLARCRCGAAFRPMSYPASADVYRCVGRDERTTECDVMPIPREPVDAALLAWLSEYVHDPDAARAEVDADHASRSADAEKAVAAARTHVATAEAGVERVKAEYVAGELTAEQHRELAPYAGERLSEARSALELAEARLRGLEGPIAADVYARWDEISRDLAADLSSVQGRDALRNSIARVFDHFLLAPVQADEPPEQSADLVVAERAPRAWVLIPQPRPEALRPWSGDLDDVPPSDVSRVPLRGGVGSSEVRIGFPWR